MPADKADTAQVELVDEVEAEAREVPEVEPRAATTWYAPNQQSVHADTLGPALVHATGATAGVPGAWTPAGSMPPARVSELQGGYPLVIAASPGTNWTVGQYVATGTTGSTGEAHWNGTAWIAGRHP